MLKNFSFCLYSSFFTSCFFTRGEPHIFNGLIYKVIVKKTSNFLWSNEGKQPTKFSYRWFNSQGDLAVFEGDGDRTSLPWTLAPGESVALNAAIKTPTTPGKYKLILTMVQEAVAWFSDQGINSPEIPLEVIYR